MASADVVFKIEADTGETLDVLKRVEAQLGAMGSAAAKVHGPVKDTGTALEGLNGKLSSADKSLMKASGGFLSLGASAFGSIAVLAAVGAAIAKVASMGADFMRGSVKSAMEAEDSFNRLNSAMVAVGEGGASRALADLANSLQSTTRYSDDAIMSMQAMAARIGVNASNMPALTRAAVDLAAALKIDVVQAGEVLARSMETGSLVQLKRMGISLGTMSEEAVKAGVHLDTLGARFSGAAAADVNTLSGATAQLANQWDELKEAFGGAFLETIGGTAMVRQLTDALTGMTSAASAVGAAVGGILAKVESLGDSKLIVALGPLGLLLKQMGEMVGGVKAGMSGWAAYGAAGVAIREEARGAGGDDGDATLQRAASAKLATHYREREEFMRAHHALKEKAAAAAESEAAQLSKQVAKLQDISALAREMAVYGETFAATEKDKVRAYDAQLSALASAKSEAILLAAQNKITDDLMIDIVGKINTARRDIEGWRDAVRATNAELEIMATTGLSLDMLRRAGMTGGAQTPKEIEGLFGQVFGQGAVEGERPQPIGETQGYDQGGIARADEQENLDRVMQMIDLRYQSEAAILAERAALDKLTAAQREEVKSKIKQMEMERTQIKLKQMWSQSMGVAAGALIDMAISGEFSAKKLLKATLESISQAAKVEAMNQTAKGFALLAAHDPGAGAAFTSAAIFAGVAIAAGAAAGAVGGGGESSGGGEQPRDSATTRDNAATEERAQEAPRGPGVTIVLSGNITSAGGPEELARMLKAEMDRLQSESGGSAATVRL